MRLDSVPVFGTGEAVSRQGHFVLGQGGNYFRIGPPTVQNACRELRAPLQSCADLMKWLERPGRTPREITQRLRIREILGMFVSR